MNLKQNYLKILLIIEIKQFNFEVSPKNGFDDNDLNFSRIQQNFKFIYHKNTYQNMLTYDLSNRFSINKHTQYFWTRKSCER